MKKSRLRLIKGIAVLIVGLTVCAWFLSPSTSDSGSAYTHSSGLSREATNLDRPHPEIQLERLLNLPDPSDRDLDIASILDPDVIPRQQSIHNSARDQEVASLPRVKEAMRNETGIFRYATGQR